MSAFFQDWLDPSGEFNQLSIVWLGTWSTWTVVTIIAMVALTLWLAWYNTSRLSGVRRGGLLLLRGCALVTFFLLFLQPTARLEDVSKVKNNVVVLLDTSRSMGLPQSASGQQTRRDEAAKALQQARTTLATWRTDHHVEFFSFDGHLNAHADLQSLLKHPSRGSHTSLSTSLNELSARYTPRELAAVVILSDGGDLAASGQVDPPLRLMRAAERLKTPIHTLSVGPALPPLDLAIAEVRADDFAFARNVVSVDVDLHAGGVTDQFMSRVSLYRGSELLSERVIAVERGQPTYQTSFEFVPDETGEEAYHIEIEPHPEEQIVRNNRARFSMRIIRDKIRVLQVVGNPSWDERFLRKHLKKNPNVELISFFILRTNASLEVARPDELSLIPFPTQELFEERLGSFDLMIFQDFTYHGYRMRRYLPLIRDYVKKGGGFVMVGGDQSFSGGGYAGTPIEQILPVRLPPNGRDQVDLGAFNPTLTTRGVRHPVTALSLSPSENTRLWSTLPQLEGTNRVRGITKNAHVLASRPAQSGKDGAPLVVAADVEEGRSLAVMTDSLWRWALSPESSKSDEGARAYHRFWGNAIRWLIRDPALNPLQVKADRDRYGLGQSIFMTARVLDPSYEPIKGAAVTFVVDEVSSGSEAAKEVIRLQGTSDEQGEVSRTWIPEQEGVYRVRAQSTIGGMKQQAQDLFVVAEDLIELRDTTPRPDLLKAISRMSGGDVMSRGQDWDQLVRKQPEALQVNRREDQPLWATWWALLIALLFPTIEWVMRRRWGLN